MPKQQNRQTFVAAAAICAVSFLFGCPSKSSHHGVAPPVLPQAVLADLVALLHFQEAAGVTSFTNAADAGASGTCTICPESGVAGKFGNAVRFGNTLPKNTVALDLPNLHIGNGDPVTVSFWMRWNGGGAGSLGLTDCNSWSIPLYFDAEISVAFHNGYFGLNSWNCDLKGVSSDGLENKWIHVAVVFQGADVDQAELYLDGELQTLSQHFDTPTPPLNLSAELFVGEPSGEYPFMGEIDEFAVFNRALTAEEIEAVFKIGELSL